MLPPHLLKIIVIILVVLTVALALRFILGGSEDGWVKHGKPSAPMLTDPCGQAQETSDIKVIFPIPVTLTPSETTRVKVYFNNDELDPEVSCNEVFPVEREIPKTQAIVREALEELIKGPTTNEKNQNYITNINPGVKIQKLTIDNGLAEVDFDKTLEQAVGGSCRATAIRSQITETLKQFSTVSNVIISIDGRTEDILQP